MDIEWNIGHVLAVIGLCLLLIVGESSQDLTELSLGDYKLCSDITKRKVKYESFLVTQGRVSHHSLPWTTPDICKFEVQSVYSRGGILAVIQTLQLRKNFTSNECIDYVQFRTKKGSSSPRHCGVIDARINMNYDVNDAPESVYPEFYPISYSNSFIDVDGEMDVIIYIAKQPLVENERTEFEIVFTSYKDCSDRHTYKHVRLQQCSQDSILPICINEQYFGDGYINCPHFKCLDEGGCPFQVKPEGKTSVGDKVIIASLSTLGVLFGLFILFIWAFRKHKLFCWAEDFAHPTPTSESNRNSCVIELNERTGTRLASEAPANNTSASAPLPDEEKDLPPSYESLFPDPPNPR